MSDIFISYAREDIEFVRVLHQELVKLNRDVWVDWEDIPPTAEWLNEIHTAIEGADAFAFIISPDSVRSDVCSQEIAHAVKQNKRLVPIVRHDVDPKAVPEALAKLNWLFFRESDDFQTALQSLIHALDADLDWVRAHTRLLVRATEWDSNGRDNSFALRGRDLQAAEQWLELGGEKEPKPTSLQTQYVIISRKATTRRQRITIGVLTLCLVVVAALGVVALYQRNEKEQQRQVSLARQLAAQADLLRTQKPEHFERSVLLAAEALHRFHSWETDQALREGLALLPHLIRDLPRQEGSFDLETSVCFSPDGQYLATSGEGIIRIWETSTWGKVASIRQNTTMMAFSNDTKYLATASDDRVVQVWELPGGRKMAETVTNGEVNKVVFSQDGRYLVAVDSDGAITDLALPAGQVSRVYLGKPGNSLLDVAISPSGRYLAVACSDGSVLVSDEEERRWIVRFDHSSPVKKVIFSKMWLATATDSTAALWDIFSGKIVASMPHPTDELINSIAFSPDGKYLATISEMVLSADSVTRLWKTFDGSKVMQIMHEGIPKDLAFSPDGQLLATASSDSTVRLWKVPSGEEFARMPHLATVDDVAFSPDGHLLCTATGFGRLASIWEVPNSSKELEHLARAILERGAKKDTISSLTGQYEVTVSFDKVKIRNLTNGQEELKFEHERIIKAVDLSPDEKYVATASSNLAHLWEMENGQETKRFQHEGEVRAVAFDPEGKFLATGEWDGTVHVWEIKSGREVTRVKHKDRITRVAFSSDGKYLVSASEDGTVGIWLWRPVDLLAEACSRFTRTLTREEWQQYLGNEPYKPICQYLPAVKN